MYGGGQGFQVRVKVSPHIVTVTGEFVGLTVTYFTSPFLSTLTTADVALFSRVVLPDAGPGPVIVTFLVGPVAEPFLRYVSIATIASFA